MIVNGWHIDRRPNSFAERYRFDVYALDADGYTIQRQGFQRKRDAVAWAKQLPAPTELTRKGA